MKKQWIRARPKPSRTNYKSCSSISRVKGLRGLYPSSFSAYNMHLSLGLGLSTPCVEFFLASNSWLWHLQYLGVCTETQVSLSYFQTLAPQGHLPFQGFYRNSSVAWPQGLSETMEKEPMLFSLLYPLASQVSIAWMILLRLTAS